MNQSFNDKAVYRTAPATSGLLTSRNKYHDSVSTIVTEHGPYECVVMTKTIFDIERNKQADISC